MLFVDGEVMVLKGIVKNGAIVLDQPQALPEGTLVEVEVKTTGQQPTTLRDLLLQSAGCMTDLPPDMAQQHDHYIHGSSKF